MTQTTRSYAWVYALLATAYVWLAWNLMVPSGSDVTVCMFKHATGFACPSCGSTRSVLSIFQGQFSEALFINPLGFLAASVLVGVPLMMLVGRWRQRDLVAISMTWFESAVKRPAVAVPLVLLVLTNWAWNIYKGL